MNTEATQDNSVTQSTGLRLRTAREQLGLTQQNVAERLCLKLTTVRDIEEDKSPADLASTFLRGYIRSYARLVHVPEEELLPMMAKQAPVRAAKVEPMQSFSLGKRRKKRDGWLMVFTWLVLFVVVGLTGAWWWQNHKAAQDDLVSLGQPDSSSGDDNSQSIPLSDSNASPATAGGNATAIPMDSGSAPAAGNAPASSNTPLNNAPAPAQPAPAQSTPNSASNAAPAAVSPSQPAINGSTSAAISNNSQPPASGAEEAAAADPNALVMNFTSDCWLEVTDSSGKKLFSGMQRSGGKLSLAGTAPYRLKIGAPAAVQIQFQGQPVDLSRYIRSNQVARLTLGAH